MRGIRGKAKKKVYLKGLRTFLRTKGVAKLELVFPAGETASPRHARSGVKRKAARRRKTQADLLYMRQRRKTETIRMNKAREIQARERYWTRLFR